MKQQLPNILTIARLVLTGAMFAALVGLSEALHSLNASPLLAPLALTALVCFVVAAVTDFFDGYLARRWNVVSTLGAILDPIADKVLVCGAILGLLGVDSINGAVFLIPSGFILFREFAVSALREVLAPRGLKLPVTFLAKTKTALQLAALAFLLALVAWAMSGAAPEKGFTTLLNLALALYWLAAIVTVWTGVEYGLSARKALRPTAPG